MGDDPNHAKEELNLEEADLEEIVERVRAGAKDPKEALDFDDASVTAIEEVALGLYRSEMYERAALVYGFALRLEPDRATCWRGLGACAQASGAYDEAVLCYRAALQRDPADLVSMACLGECLCLGGHEREGRELLRNFVEQARADPALGNAVARARAILGGADPSS